MSPRPLCEGCGAPSDCRSRYTGEALCASCEGILAQIDHDSERGYLCEGALPRGVYPRSREHGDWIHGAVAAALAAEGEE